MPNEGEKRDFINKKPLIAQKHFGKGRILSTSQITKWVSSKSVMCSCV